MDTRIIDLNVIQKFIERRKKDESELRNRGRPAAVLSG